MNTIEVYRHAAVLIYCFKSSFKTWSVT